MYKFTSLTLAFTIFSYVLFAQTTRTWTGSVSTAWNNGSNWSPVGVPAVTDHVIVVTGSNVCALSANTSIVNCTITSGTLNLGGFTLSATGAAVANGGSCNNGIFNPIGTSATFAGTTFGAAVNANVATLIFNGGIFNSTVTAIKTGASNDAGNGGCTFNGVASFTNSGSGYLMFGNSPGLPDTWNADVTFTNTGSERILPCWNAIGNQFNGNIIVNTSGSAQGINFCGGSASATATLAATRTIMAGGTGLTAGYLILQRFTQLGSANINLTGIAATSYIQFGPSSTIGGNVNITSTGILLHGCTFNGTTNFSKTGLSNDNSNGGNTFVGVSTFNHSGTGNFLMGNGAPDLWQSAATFNNTGGGIIYVAHNHSGLTTTFQGVTSINNTSSVGGNPGVRFAEAGTTSVVTFNGAATINNGGTAPSPYILFGSGNNSNVFHFNSTLTVNQNNTGSSAVTQFGGTATVNLADNVVVNNTSGNGSWIGFTMNGGSTTLTNGKTISVGSGGFANGLLHLRRFVQVGSTAQSLTMSGLGGLSIGPLSTFNGNFNSSSPSIYLNSCVFNGTSTFVKTGTSGDYSNGGNTFNGIASFTNSGSSFLVLGNALPDVFNTDVTFTSSGSERVLPGWASAGNQFNGNIYVNSTGLSTGINFGGGASSASSTLAATKSVIVGSLGFSAGYLILQRFTQLGNAPIAITMASTANYIQFGPNSQIGGNVTSISPRVYLEGCLFQGTTSFTKIGTGNDHSAGGNTFTGACILNHNGSNNFLLGANNQDTWLSNATFNNNGDGIIYLGHSHGGATSVFNGAVIANNNSAGSGNPGIRFAEGSTSVGITFQSTVVINNAGTGNGNYVAFTNGSGNNTIVFNGVVTVNQTNTGTAAITYFGNQGTLLFNENIVVNNTSGASSWVGFSMNGGSSTLAAGKTIVIGSTGFTNGILYMRRFTQLGNTAQNLLLTGNGNLTFGPASNFGGNVTSVSPGLNFNGCTFNGTTHCTKNGSTNDNSAGANVFTGVSTISNTSSGYLLFGNGASDLWQTNVTFSNSGAGVIYVAHNHNSGTSTFNGTVTVDVTSAGTAQSGVRFAEASSTGVVVFNGPVIVNNGGTGSSNYVGFANSTAGNTITFNNTLTINQTNSGTSAQTIIGNNSVIQLNENVVVNNASGFGSLVGFAMNGGSATLASGKTISIGSTGFNNGNLFLRRFVQLGTTAQNLTLTGTAGLTYGPSSTFNGAVTSVSPSLFFNGCIFNSTTDITKNGSSGDASNGANTFVGNAILSNTSFGNLIMGNGSADQWNANAVFNNTGTGILYLAHNHNGANSIFNGSVTVNVTSSGTSTSGVRFAEASSSAILTFNGPVTVNNGGTGSSNFVGFANSAAGNVINFNHTLTVNQTNTGTSAITRIGESSTIYLNGNVVLNNTSGANSWIGFAMAGGSANLASGRTIAIGGIGYASGALYLRRMNQLGSTSQTIQLTGSAHLLIQSNGNFNANLFYSAPQVTVEGSTFNGVSRFTKTGGSNNYSGGGNTFNGNTHFINTGIGDFGLANGTGDDYNALARFVQTGTGLMRPIHNATSTFSGNIAVDSCTTAITFGTAGNGIMWIDGNGAQQFNGDINFIPTVSRLTMGNGVGGSLTLNVPVINSISTTFITGDIFTSGSNYYRFNSGATYSGVSNASHIAGIGRRLGTGSFVYPIGNGTIYQPVTVNATVNASGIDVQYFASDAGVGPFLGGAASPPNLTAYNSQEYWNVNPVTSATGVVTVNWDGQNDPSVSTLAEARVGHKLSGNWQNEGATAAGTIANGSVSSDPISTWGPFTLGLTCPTPIGISCPASITVIAPTGSCTASVTMPLATATGVCGSTVINNSFNGNGANASGNYPIGITTVTYTATSATGSTATCSMTVTVTDNQGPVLTCPANITQNLIAGCDATISVPRATALDQCVQQYSLNFAGGTELLTTPNAAALQLTGNFSIEASVYLEGNPTDWVRIAGKGNSTFRNYGLWYHKPNNTWLFQSYMTDGSNVSAQFVSTINLNTWYHVAGVKSGNSYSLYLNGTLVATANTNQTPYTSTDPLTVGYGTFHAGHIGNIDNVRIWNSALTAAQMACSASGTPCANPSGLIVNYDFESGIGGPVVFNRASSAHSGTVSSSITSSDWESLNAPGNGMFVTNSLTNTCDASGTFNVGSTSIVWTATDASGNSSACTQTVTVSDLLTPTITCPSNINVNTAPGTCAAVVNYPIPNAIDNCGNCSAPPTLAGMTLLGTYNATAYYISNSTTSWATANTAATNFGGYLASIGSAAENAFILNGVTTTLGSFNTYWIGLNDGVAEGTFVWSNGQAVTYSNWNSGQPDNSGNTEDFVHVWTAAGTWNDLNGANAQRYVLELPCIPVTRTAGPATGSAFPVGTTVVTHSATDASGNTVSCSFNVVVTDNITPTISCPATQTISLNSTCTASIPDYTSMAIAADNCTVSSNLIITQSPAAGTLVSGSGTTVVTLTVQDQAGNTSNCAFNLNRVDNSAPTMVCPTNITTNVSGISCGAAVNYTLSMTDNCTTASNCSPDAIAGFIKIGVLGGHTYFRSTTPLTWTAANTQANTLGGHLVTITTAAENTYLQSFSNHWIGLTDQTTEGVYSWVTGETLTFTNWLTGEPNNSSNEDYIAIWNTSGGWNDWNGTGTANYIVEFDCGYNLLAGLPSGSTFPVGTTINTYTVTDFSGNTSAPCSFNVVVVDNISPTITCQSNVINTVSAGSCTRSVTTTNPTFADNCSVTTLTWTMTGATTLTSPTLGLNYVGTQAFNIGVTTVTYTAIDASGNTAVCSFSVTINDNINPIIACPSNLTQSVSIGSCTASVATAAPVTSDNCTVAFLRWALTGATVASSPLTGINNLGTYVFNLGTTTVTYTVLDGAGNISTCSYTVVINDNLAPSISCPANINANVALGSCNASVTTSNPVYTDNCTVSKLTWSMSGATVAVSPSTGVNNVGTYTFNGGTTVVTYSVEDAAGNITTCSFNVLVTDNLNPTIACPANITAVASSGAGCSTSVSIANAITADNCAVTRLTWVMTGATVASSPALGINNIGSYTFNVGVTTVTYNVSDAANNISSCTFNVTVTDAIAPTISCPSNISANAEAGTCEANVTTTNPTISDNCTVNRLTWSMTGSVEANSAPNGINYVGSYVFPQGVTTITYTLTDAGNNSSACSFTVTVNDNIVPTIVCPPAVTGTLNPSDCFASGLFLGIPAVDDNCGVEDIFNNAPLNFTLGATSVTWTVTDAAGLTATCVQSVMISDNVAPTLTCGPNATANAVTGLCSATVTLTPPTVSELCNSSNALALDGTNDFVNLSSNALSSATSFTYEAWVYVRTHKNWARILDMGNGPGISMYLSTSNALTGIPRFAINIGGGEQQLNAASPLPINTWKHIAVTLNGTTARLYIDGVQVAQNTSFSLSPASLGNTSINRIGRSQTASHGYFDGMIDEVRFWNVARTQTQIQQSMAVSLNGNESGLVRYFRMNQGVGGGINTGLTSLTATIGNNATLNNFALNGMVSNFVVANNNSTSGVSLSNNFNNSSDASGNYTVGATNITWTATDASGNTATCVQTVTVVDNQLPTITCPANLTVNASNGACTASSVNLGAPITADNCTVTSVTNNAPATYQVGTTNVTWTVTDASGNTATCVQTVTVVDNQLPTITCPANVTVNADNGSCTASSVNLGAPITADNCTVATVTNNAPAIYPAGVTNVIWTATDASGNTATCTQTVTVNDAQLPTIVCPANVTVNASNGGCTASSVVLGTPISSDNCAVVSVTNNAPAMYSTGITTVIWTVTDAAGNTATCAQTVTVTDDEIPTIVCPSDLTLSVDQDACEATGVNLGTPVNTDNCTVATVTNDAPSSFPLGSTTVTWTVTDAAGNTATCTQTVTVNDTQLPTITCPSDVTISTDTDACEATGVNLSTPVSADNCTVATVTNDAPASFPLGSTTVIWTVTDAAGNTATCAQTVAVNDTQLPTITCPSDVIISTDADACEATGVNLGTPVTADNCTVATVSNDALASFPLGSTTVIWTVTDAAGNTATCAQTVTVNDTQLPTITCPSDMIISTDADACEATGVNLGTPVTADNCTVATVTNDAPASFPLGSTTVIWTVTDAAGNTATCVQTVTVNDTQLPTITCPSDVIISTDADACEATGVNLGTPVITDNCTVTTVTNDAPATFPLGSTTVIWTVTDAAGNTATCVQTVTVNDTQLPTITCPSDVIISTDADACEATGVNLSTPVTADNCTVATVTNDAPASFPLGSTTVIWTVTDAAGNTATCAQTVAVNDTQLPTITCPSDVIISTDADACEATGVNLGTPVTADNCTVATVSNDALASFPLGSTNVIWTVTDAAGNTATCAQTVTVNDTQLPTITCPSDMIISTDADACEATGVNLGTPVTADNCTVATVTNDAPASFPLGSTNVIWTVTDAAGNTATCTQTVTVSDTQLPTITCPSDVIISTDADACEATGVTLGAPVTADNCTVATVTNDAPASFPLGSTTVIWTVNDASGNTATCIQTVTVNDNQLPTIICPSDVIVSTDVDACEATAVNLGTPVTSDNCTVATVTNDAPASFPLGSTTVTWTVQDAAGNTATCTQTVTVNDTELPTIVCPSDITTSTDADACDATGVALGAPITADNCTVASVTNDAPASFPLGSTTVIWTVTDAAGNTATCTQTVMVTDDEIPTIVCPSDLTLSVDQDACEATGVNLGTPLTADNCAVATVTNDAPASFPLGSTTVIWTVNDAAGNSASCTQTVTVNDTELPTIVCPSDVTITTDTDACEATGVNLGIPATSDNCTMATVTNDAPASFPLGSTTVIWTVTDAAGNTVTCTQTVTVNDTQLPTITCPSDVIVSTDADACEATGVNLGTSLTADNCAVATVTNDAPASFPLGSTTVIWTVTDAAGNTATCTQTVTVNDTQFPTITCPSDVIISTDADACEATGFTLGAPVTADNCTVATVTNDAPASFPLGSTTVTWIVTDAAGNTATCTQTVTVNDTQLPTITCPSDVIISTDADACEATGVNLGAPATADNCTVATVTNNAPASYPAGVTNVIWTATDASGNTATCTQTVTVNDTQLPTIVCPANVTVNASNGGCTASSVALGTPISSDNCAVVSVTNNAPATYSTGITTVIWTVTDAAGNTATCTQTVTVTDDEIPTIVCPSDLTLSVDQDACEATGVNLGTPVTADNCTVATVTNDAPASFPLGSRTVTWTVTDAAGNSAICTQVVTVTDDELPTIVCPSDITTSTDTDACEATGVNLGAPVTADNCTVASVTNNAPASFPLGSTTVIWTVTDASGNTATCTQTVTVNDTQLPTITCPSDVTISTDADACEATGVNLGTPLTADNCTVATVTNDAPASFPLGSTTVIWTVTDAAGNTVTCTQTVTVNDTQLPTITCPATRMINTNQGACVASEVDLGEPAASDNCTIVNITNNAPEFFTLGMNEVIWTAMDASGNTAICIQSVIVQDEESPMISCPENIQVNTDIGSCVATNVNLGEPIISDNCTEILVTNDAPASYPVGLTEVLWTIADGNGNVSNCIQMVVVVDNQIPTISCGETIIIYSEPNECSVSNVILPMPLANDNCSLLSVTSNAPLTFAVGTTEVTWTAIDAHGNLSSCDQLVTVLDTIPPSAAGCGQVMQFDTDPGFCGAIVNYDLMLESDNCEMANYVLISGQASGTFFNVGEHTVEYLLTDIHGNTSTCSWIISVVDTEEPVISCMDDISTSSEATICGAIINYDAPSVSDNCPANNIEGVLISGLPSGSNFPVGITEILYELTDGSGNVSSCSFQVTVIDITPPQIVCPSDVSVNDPELDGQIVNYELPDVTDNCGAMVNVIEGPMTGEVFEHGLTTVVFEAIDNAGLTANCTFNVLVNNAPNAEVDNLLFDDYLENANITVLQNDMDPDGDEIMVISATALNGNAEVLPSGLIVYTADPSLYCGMDTITYIIQDIYMAMDTSIVIVEIECPFSVSVPEVITPNGDGINDVLMILGIEDYPNSQIQIFNKRGHKVYEASGVEAKWDGKSQTYLDLGSGLLPEDTYYYVLDLGDGTDMIKGYIYLTY
jgi:gliding motility-associated-like protein